MKLYRKVKASGGCLTFHTPIGVPIHLEPIEITEEEIEAMAEGHCGYTEDDIDNDTEMACLYEGYIAGAEAIISKLKGE